MKWKKGDVVMADWNGCFYKAKIINVSESNGETHYKIHYDSWSSKWDQVVPESKTDKWKAFTAEAEEAARKQIKDLKATPKRQKRNAADDAGPSDDAAPSEPKKKEAEELMPLLHFSETLKNILCEDFDKMTNSGLYAAMPTKVTIRRIIQELCAKVAASNEEEMTVEVEYVDGKKVIEKTTKHELTAFGHMLERLVNLLFTCLCVDRDKQQVQRLEDELLSRNNNNDLMKPFAPSEHFGVVYLLRLFVKLNNDSSFIDAHDRYSFVKHSSYLLKHLLDNIDNYYDKDAYDKTPTVPIV